MFFAIINLRLALFRHIFQKCACFEKKEDNYNTFQQIFSDYLRGFLDKLISAGKKERLLSFETEQYSEL